MPKIAKKLAGQVWIETVIYTVIGISLIAMVLAFVTPKVAQAKDKLAIEQSIRSLQEMDERMQDVMSKGDGNRRTLDFALKRGILAFNASGDTVVLTIIDVNKPYSEIGVPIKIGSVSVLSTRRAKNNMVALSIKSPYDLTYQGENKGDMKQLTASAIPYVLSIENVGNQILNVREISKG